MLFLTRVIELITTIISLKNGHLFLGETELQDSLSLKGCISFTHVWNESLFGLVEFCICFAYRIWRESMNCKCPLYTTGNHMYSTSQTVQKNKNLQVIRHVQSIFYIIEQY